MYVLYRERNFIKSPTLATQELRLVVSNARLTFYVNQISKNAYSCIIYLPFFHSIKHIHCFFIIIIIIYRGLLLLLYHTLNFLVYVVFFFESILFIIIIIGLLWYLPYMVMSSCWAEGQTIIIVIIVLYAKLVGTN